MGATGPPSASSKAACPTYRVGGTGHILERTCLARPECERRGTHLDHSREVVVLLGRVDVVRIDGADIAVAAVDAAALLPFLDDLLQPGARSLEICSANDKTPLAGALKTPRAIVRIGPAPLVSGLVPHLLLGELSLLGLSLSTDPREPTESAGLLVEGGRGMFNLAPWTPNSGVRLDLGSGRPPAPLLGQRWVGHVRTALSRPRVCLLRVLSNSARRQRNGPDALAGVEAVPADLGQLQPLVLPQPSQT